MTMFIGPDRRRREERRCAEGIIILCANQPLVTVTARLTSITSCGFRVHHGYPGFTPGQALRIHHAGHETEVRVVWVRYFHDCIETDLIQRETYLIQRLKLGEGELFSELVSPYLRNLRTCIHSIVRGWEDTEEVLQETLLKVFAHLDQFDTGQSFRAWLSQIAINEARKDLRKNRRHWQIAIDFGEEREQPFADFMDQLVDHHAGPAEAFEHQEFILAVWSAAEDLDEIYRQVFILRDLRQLDMLEVAATLGISVDTANTRLHRARLQMRARLKTIAAKTHVQGRMCAEPVFR